MRMVVLGAGGVGGLLAARLAQAGEDVTVVARGEHGESLRRDGLCMHTAAGEERVTLRVVAATASLEPSYDAVFVAVKWPDLEGACEELARLLSPHGLVVPLLNGLESEDVVSRYVGAQRTLAGVAYMSSGIVRPGEIYVHGHARIGLAPYREGQDQDLARLASCIERAGLPVRRAEDYRAMLWEKMVWNAPFNAICALTRKPAGVVADQLTDLVREAMLEVIKVAAAEGIQLPLALPDAMLQLTRSEYPHTEPSMLQDVRRQRATEVDILQDAVTRRGQALGVDVPVMRTLAALVHGLTS